MDTIIYESKIEEILKNSKNHNKFDRLNIIKKAENYKGLNLEEAAILLQITEEDELDLLFKTAKRVKEHIYGNRIVFFAPLYTSSACTNNCLYCGFRSENTKLIRRTLNISQVVNEAKKIELQGHKRVLLVCGEDKTQSNIDHIINSVGAIYESTGIRRINVNAAPMSTEDFAKLNKANIGTYQLFQETYHRDTYNYMHPTGIKSNYDYRLEGINRAFESGIDDFGIGVLLGLYDYKFEVLASLMHSEYLESKYNVGPHTVSIPRLMPAYGSLLKETPFPVSDIDLKKVVAIYRLALPYTGIILSTREGMNLRNELLDLGISQLSAGSQTGPSTYEETQKESSQFEISDKRNVNEMFNSICEKGYLPSFCTACYRRDRRGEAFMQLAKGGDISVFCQSNAILTFKENIEDYVEPNMKEKYNNIILKEIDKIKNLKIKETTQIRLKQIEQGERDLYF